MRPTLGLGAKKSTKIAVGVGGRDHMASKWQCSGVECFLLRRYRIFWKDWACGFAPMEYRFAPAIEKLQNWLQRAPVAQRPRVMFGTSHSGHEIRICHIQMKKIQPPVAVLITPSEAVLASVPYPSRAQHLRIDSSVIGDVF